MKRKQSKQKPPERLKPVLKPSVDDPKSYIRKEFEFFKKIRSKAENEKKIDPAQFDLESALEKRRTQALLNSIKNVEKYGLTDDWIIFNVSCSGYAQLEQNSHILLGAAIWILDRIEETDYDRRDLYRLLPTDEDKVFDYTSCVDVWDCSFETDLITSVEYVLHVRNEDIAPLENDGMNGHRVLTSKLAAEDKAHGDVPSRQRFERLLSMIPQVQKDLAVKHFKEYFDKWVERFFACVKSLDDECAEVRDKLNAVGKKINAIEDELEKLIKQRDNMWQAPPKKSSKPSLAVTANKCLEEMINPAPMFGTVPQELEADSVYAKIKTQLDKLGELEIEYNGMIEELNDVERKKGEFLFRLGSFASLSAEGCSDIYGDAVADAITPLSVANPFEMCFAMLYLIEQDSDLPWLYGACHGVMFEAAEALPWGVYEYDEMEDEVWDEHPPVSKRSDIPNWYSREYKMKGDDFPRSFAQILYEETGCLMPRDMHQYDSKLKILGKYGIRQNKAIAMLYCMLALGNARRSTRALNFEEQYMEHINNGFELNVTDNTPKTEEQLEIQRLRAALHKAEKAAKDADKRLADYKAKSEAERQELADLREIVFKANADEQEEPAESAVQFPYEMRHDTVIFGGHETWVKAIKPMLKGEVRFVSKELVNFDLSLIRTAEVVWVQSNAIPHKTYYRIIDAVRKYGKPLRYFAYASAAKCAEQAAEFDMNLT